MVDYLVSSCGLSGAEALRASKPLAHLKSPEKPDAVLRLLRQEGLGDADIKRAVLRLPKVLLCKPKKTVEPKIRALRRAGFSSQEIARLISTSPRVFYARDVPHRVEFWRKLVGTNQKILQAVMKDPSIRCYSLDNTVIPRLSLFRSLGVPDDKLGTLMRTNPRLVTAKPDRIQTLVEQVNSVAFSPEPPMYVAALSSLGSCSRTALDARSKLLRSFGWTQSEPMHPCNPEVPNYFDVPRGEDPRRDGFLAEGSWGRALLHSSPSQHYCIQRGEEVEAEVLHPRVLEVESKLLREWQDRLVESSPLFGVTGTPASC